MADFPTKYFLLGTLGEVKALVGIESESSVHARHSVREVRAVAGAEEFQQQRFIESRTHINVVISKKNASSNQNKVDNCTTVPRHVCGTGNMVAVFEVKWTLFPGNTTSKNWEVEMVTTQLRRKLKFFLDKSPWREKENKKSFDKLTFYLVLTEWKACPMRWPVRCGGGFAFRLSPLPFPFLFRQFWIG